MEHEASRAGISVDTLIERTFTPRPQPQAVDNPMLQRLQAQLREAEQATPAEVAQAETEWLTFQQNMDAPRRANGERLLFPDVQPQP